VILYAESSAVLSWLLSESRGLEVESLLQSASLVVTSDITDVECARVLQRGAALGLLDVETIRALRATYQEAASQWDLLALSERVRLVASGRFPVEPVRALDAVHLASVLVAREAWPGLALLSLDVRVRANAAALGVDVLPP
jgi:hypothetical protein